MTPSASAPLAAVTGATGFIGRHVVAALADAGWRVRLLLRRTPDDPAWQALRPEVVAGSLHDATALDRLVDGADAVVHLAGLIKASRRAQFDAVNRDGVAALAHAVARRAPQAHLVLVSSLAAREPQLSDYAASKHAGETALLAQTGIRASVLRPPAVYGPGDRETLLFFKLAQRPVVPLLGGADQRAALIHVRDLADAVVALCVSQPLGAAVATVADAHPGGYGWRRILGAAAHAIGHSQPRFVQAPPLLLRTLALAGDVARAAGHAGMLHSQKLRELRHPDWAVAPSELWRPPGWAQRFDLEAGFADAVRWYRAAGWL